MSSRKLSVFLADVVMLSESFRRQKLAANYSLPPGELQSPTTPVIIKFTNYVKASWGGVLRASEHAILSCQTLSDLIDVIRCPSLHRPGQLDGQLPSNGCVFCFEDRVYADDHLEENYAE